MIAPQSRPRSPSRPLARCLRRSRRRRPHAPQAPPRSPYQEAGTLPARIMDFKAEPSSIKPGESTTLTWAVENPRTTTIEPTIGRATPRGVLKVTPKATTTYTLTVTGVNGTLTKTVTVNVAGTTPVAATAVVAPDLAASAAHRRRQAGPDRRVRLRRRRRPWRAAARRCTWFAAANADAEARRREVPRGPRPRRHRAVLDLHAAGRSADVHGPVLRAVHPGAEAPGHPARVPAPVAHDHDGRLAASARSRSVLDGPLDRRWDGDTLVVDSVGFKESEINGYRTTEALHVVERFRRPNLGTLEYEAVIEDPNVFAGPWLITRTFPFLPEHNRVDEFFCENNRDYKPLFGK